MKWLLSVVMVLSVVSVCTLIIWVQKWMMRLCIYGSGTKYLREKLPTRERASIHVMDICVVDTRVVH